MAPTTPGELYMEIGLTTISGLIIAWMLKRYWNRFRDALSRLNVSDRLDSVFDKMPIGIPIILTPILLMLVVTLIIVVSKLAVELGLDRSVRLTSLFAFGIVLGIMLRRVLARMGRGYNRLKDPELTLVLEAIGGGALLAGFFAMIAYLPASVCQEWWAPCYAAAEN